MPKFSEHPPAQPEAFALRMIRPGPKGALRGIITSDHPIGCPTHWYNGRTTPCEAPDCPACDAGFSWRWHAYFGIYSPNSHEHALLELTAKASEPIFEYFENHRTIRGMLLEARRAGQRFNGRVLCKCSPADTLHLALPPPPDIPLLLAHIWGCPATATSSRPDPDNCDRIKLDPRAESLFHKPPASPGSGNGSQNPV